MIKPSQGVAGAPPSRGEGENVLAGGLVKCEGRVSSFNGHTLTRPAMNSQNKFACATALEDTSAVSSRPQLLASRQKHFVVFVLLACLLTFPAAAQIQQAWVTRYNNGITNGTNQAVKMLLDSGGNIIVTGFSRNTNNQLGYVTIKYAPNGNQLWATRYDSTNSPSAMPAAMVIDTSNNVIVTGSALTIKYDSSGNVLWTAPYAGTALAVDKDANVYVAGFSQDFGTVKLSPQGSNVWLNTFVETYGPTISDSVLVDGNENVYVSGLDSYHAFTNNGIRYGPYVQLTTIKYDSGGNQLWKQSQTPETDYSSVQCAGAAFDTAGDLYLLSNWPGFIGYYLNKYSACGSNLWEITPNGSGASEGTGLAIDSNTNIVLCGVLPYQYLNYSFVYYTYKINSDGATVWGVPYSKPSFAKSIGIDVANNSYVTGSSQATNGTNNIVPVKYGPNGSQNWVESYNGLASGNASGNAIAVDKNFSVYVTGYETLPGGGTGIVTIKYKPVSLQPQSDGTVLLETQGSPGESFDIEASSDLMNWLDLGTFMADTNGLLQFEDTNAPNFPARFYYTNPK